MDVTFFTRVKIAIPKKNERENVRVAICQWKTNYL
jgi:hypothetical protein